LPQNISKGITTSHGLGRIQHCSNRRPLRKVALTFKQHKGLVMHVCVLGAGIVGLATAYSLHRAGHEVTVVDRATPGSGASGGNGAQLSYSYVQPLADPGIWRQLAQAAAVALLPVEAAPSPGHPPMAVGRALSGGLQQQDLA
jgi:hypothetical protein